VRLANHDDDNLWDHTETSPGDIEGDEDRYCFLG
jgi:hypothetical protein